MADGEQQTRAGSREPADLRSERSGVCCPAGWRRLEVSAMSTILVVGSAPCLYDDVEAALKLRPFASLMLVNGACPAFENAEHMLCGHEEKASFFVRERRRVFPNAPPIEVHG